MSNPYKIDWNEYAALARQAVAEGCVLLKNDDKALPIRKGERVSVFGRIQFDYYKSGTGSGGAVNTRYVTNILDALKENKDISVNEELEQTYRDWLKDHPFEKGMGWAQEPWCQEEMPVTKELAEQAAAKSDIAVVIIGRTAGEDKDNSAAEGSYLLTTAEHQMLKEVCGAFKRVAVLLNVGNIIDMKWVKEYDPAAVLYVWQGGQEGGAGAADILTGTVTPCGKLSDTIALDISDYPSTEGFGDPTRVIYKEDIYVGYRYFETFAKDCVLYPFGYGLSYTTFTRTVESFDFDGETVTEKVTVKNTGDVQGKEVVTVFVEAPQGKLGKAARSLAAFAKTETLQPGESETLTLTFPIANLASYVDFSGEYQFIDDEAPLDISAVNTEKGASTVLGIRYKKNGLYKFVMRVKANANEVAQIPMSIFIDGNLRGMVMINGTNGEVVTAEQDIGVLFGGTNYLKLYFGQTGMEIEEIKFVCTQAF